MSAVILTPAESRIVLLRSAAGYRIVRPSGYVLPVAGASTLGGVKVGSGLSVAGDGTLSANTSITDDTALGTLTDTTTPAFLLVGAAAGDRARKLTPTGWGLSNLLASVPAGRVPYADGSGLVTSNAGLTFNAGTGAFTAGGFSAGPNSIFTVLGGQYLRLTSGSGNVYVDENLWVLSSGGHSTAITPSGVKLGPARSVTWTAIDPTTVADTGLARDSAGTVRVTNGSTGVGNLITGNLTVRQPLGTAGSNEVQIFNDGSSGRLLAQNGFRLNGLGSANGQLLVGNASGLDVVALQGGGTGGVVAVPSTGRFAFSSNTSSPQNNQVLALSLLDNNTIEVNNGTRTGSGGAFRDFIGRTLYATTTGTGTGNEFIIIGGGTNKTIGSYSNLLGYSYQLVGDSTGNGGPMNFRIGAQGSIAWRSTNRSDSGVDDARIRRSSANVLDLDTGTDNAFGDLRLRNLTASGAITAGNAAADTRSIFRSVNSLPLGVSMGSGAFYLGASAATTTPDLVISNNSGVERLRVTDGGVLTTGGSVRLTTYGSYVGVLDNERIEIPNTGILVHGRGTANAVLRVRGPALHTGNLLQLENNAGTAVASVSAAGLGTFEGVSAASFLEARGPNNYRWELNGSDFRLRNLSSGTVVMTAGGVSGNLTANERLNLNDANCFVRRFSGDGFGELSGLNGSALLVGSTRRITVNTTGIGFFGVTPVARPTLPDAGTVTAADIRTALISLGLCQ